MEREIGCEIGREVADLNDAPGPVITGPTRLVTMPIEGNAQPRCARWGLDEDVQPLVRWQERRG